MTLRIMQEINFIEINDLDNDRMMISLFDNDSNDELGNVAIEKYQAKQIISFLKNHFKTMTKLIIIDENDNQLTLSEVEKNNKNHLLFEIGNKFIVLNDKDVVQLFNYIDAWLITLMLG